MLIVLKVIRIYTMIINVLYYAPYSTWSVLTFSDTIFCRQYITIRITHLLKQKIFKNTI